MIGLHAVPWAQFCESCGAFTEGDETAGLIDQRSQLITGRLDRLDLLEWHWHRMFQSETTTALQGSQKWVPAWYELDPH